MGKHEAPAPAGHAQRLSEGDDLVAAAAAAPSTRARMSCMPVFNDFVQDRVRSRWIAVLVPVFLFCIAAFDVLQEFPSSSTIVAGVQFTSSPPLAAFIGFPLSRAPRVQVVSDSQRGLKDVPATVSVKSVILLSTRNTLECSTSTLQSPLYAGTLRGMRYAQVCQPVVTGTFNTSTGLGLASFFSLQFQRGPPGLYTLSFTAGDYEATANIQVFSNVYTLFTSSSEAGIDSDPPESVTIGTALSPTPKVVVISRRGSPVAGKQVLMYVGESPVFFSTTTVVQSNRRGQQFATLTGELSRPSSEGSGVAEFDAVTVTGATSPIVYLYFYIEGTVFSWANPDDRPSSVHLPSVPEFHAGANVATTVTNVAITTQPSLTVMEGQPFAVQPTLRVTDTTGAGVAGRKVFALVTVANGFVLPNLYEPDVAFMALKTLTGAMATALTDANGDVTFDALAFTVYGSTSGGAHRIVFVCDGVYSAWTPNIAVTSSVATVALQVVPVHIPLLAGSTGANEELPIVFASVKVTNAAGAPVPGKFAVPVVVDSSGTAVSASLASVGTSYNAPDNVPQYTSDDGYATIPLVVNFLVNSSSPDPPALQLAFVVDGVRSNVSNSIIADPATTAPGTTTLPAAYLRTITPPPESVRVNESFTVKLMAVDSSGNPVAGVAARLTSYSSLTDVYENLGGMFTMSPAIPQAVSGADGIVTFTDVVFASAPVHGTCMLLATGPGASESVVPIDYYSEFFTTAVTNDVAQVLLGDVSNRQATYYVGQLTPDDLTMDVPVKVLDADGNGVAGQRAIVVMTQVPANMKFFTYTTTPSAPTYVNGRMVNTYGNAGQTFLTMSQPQEGSAPDGSLSVKITLGKTYPGVYGAVVDVAGVRSTVGLVYWMSPVASVTIVTQPSNGVDSDGQANVLLLGNLLSVQPRVLLQDKDGNPLQGYTVNAGFGTDEILGGANENSNNAPVIPDLVNDNVHNLLGLRISEPSDANGIASFTGVTALDALTGCYRLAFFHLFAEPSLSVVFSAASTPVCVRNKDSYKIVQQPSTVTSPGSPFVRGVGVSIERDYKSTLDTAGIVVSFALVDRYINSFRSPYPEVYSVLSDGNFVFASKELSPLYLENNVCIYFDGDVVEGPCSGLQSTQSVTSDGTTVYASRFQFTGIAWDNALPGDALTLRAFGPLVMMTPQAYNYRRQERVVGGCDGPASAGEFGACCSANAQCASGVCDTSQRACTKACSAATDCPPPPDGNTGVFTGLHTGFGVCLANGKCSAGSLAAWSFAPYCSTCTLANYSGDAGPPSLSDAAIGQLYTLVSTMEAACLSLGVQQQCDELEDVVTVMLQRVVQLCESPALASFCTGGFRASSAEAALIAVLRKKLGNSGATVQEVANAGVQALFSQEPQELPGRSAPTNRVEMQTKPAAVSIITQPPEAVRVGQVFPVDVMATVASGAPVPLVKVGADITDITTTTLTETVSEFVGKISGDSPDPQAAWVKAELDTSRRVATTDANGLARFKLRITAAQPGTYSIIFRTNGAISSKSVTINVTNSVHSVSILGNPGLSTSIVKFPVTLDIPAFSVKLADSAGRPVSAVGGPLDVHVFKQFETTSVANASKDFLGEYGTMSSYQKAATMFQLLVQGGRQLNILPPPTPHATVTVVSPPTLGEDGLYHFARGAVKLRVLAAGDLRLVVVAGAITSPTSSDHAPLLAVSAIDTSSVAYKLTVALLKAGIFLLGGAIWIGNSTWHSRWWGIVSIVFTAASIGLTFFITDGNMAQRVSLLVALSLLFVCYALLLVFSTRGDAKAPDHARDRQDVMAAYTRRVWSRTARRVAKPGGAGAGAGAGFGAAKRSGRGREEPGIELKPTGGTGASGKSAAESKPSASGTGSKRSGSKARAAAKTRLMQQLEADKHKEMDDAHRRAFMTNLRASIASIRGGDNPDAFFYPMRMLAALAVSLVANSLILYTSVGVFKKMQSGVETMDTQAIRTVFTALSSMEAHFAARFNSDMFTGEVQWGYEQAAVLHEQFVDMSLALFAAFITGLVLACIAYTAAWLVLVLDLRGQVLSARVGSFNFNRAKVRVADASNYFGIQISNSIMTYCLIILAVSVGAFPVYWSVSRNLIIDEWRLWLALLVPTFINLIFKKIFGYSIVTSAKPFDHIRMRRCYHLYDLIQMFLQLYTGIMTAIVRFITVVVISLATLPRLDRSPMPAWVERYLLLDTGSKSYQGMIMQVHEFNNPVATTALAILVGAGVTHDTNRTGDAKQAARKARARTRWHLAYTLLRNPSIRVYRKDKDTTSGQRRSVTSRPPRGNRSSRHLGDKGMAVTQNPLRMQHN